MSASPETPSKREGFYAKLTMLAALLALMTACALHHEYFFAVILLIFALVVLFQ